VSWVQREPSLFVLQSAFNANQHSRNLQMTRILVPLQHATHCLCRIAWMGFELGRVDSFQPEHC
jgi:hypothetical protein